MSIVLDASALLALLDKEPGTEVVAGALDRSVVSSVNWSEVLQKLRQRGTKAPAERVDGLLALGMGVRLFTQAHASRAAAMTADPAWRKVDLGVRVQLIR